MSSILGVKFNHLRRREIKVFAGIAIIYFVLWLFLPKPSFWGLDNGFKYLGAKSFSESASIKINYSGAEFDPKGAHRPLVFPFSVMRDGYQIPVFSPAFMAVSGVFNKLFGLYGLYLVPLLGGLFCIAAAWLMWIRHRANQDGRIFLIVLAFGSPLLFYSLTIWEYSISMGLIVLSVTTLCRGRYGDDKPKLYDPVIAGALIAAAAAFRTESLIWAIVLVVFWTHTNQKLRNLAWFAAGLGAGLLIMGLFNTAMTGEALPLHIKTNLSMQKMPSMKGFVLSRMQNFYSLTIEGFCSNFGSLLASIPLLLIAFWRDWRRGAKSGYGMLVILIAVWSAYTYVNFTSPDRAGHTISSGGILWVTPFAVLAFNYFKGERRKFLHLIWIGTAMFLFAGSIFLPSIQGVHWGPRLVIQIFPFLLMLSATRAQRWWRKHESARPIIVALIVMSLVNNFYSYGILLETKNKNKELTRWAAITGSEPSATNIGWLPGDVSTLSGQHPWFVASRLHGIQTVVSGLRDAGYKRINFYEIPPYISDDVWWRTGVEPVGEDYLPTATGIYAQLRRKWLNIIPLHRSP